MKYFLLLFFPVLTFLSCGLETDESLEDEIVETKPKYTFTSFEQKISYCIGLDHGTSSRQFFLRDNMLGKFSVLEVERGLVDYLAGNDLRIMPYELDSIFSLYLSSAENVDSTIVSCADGSYAYGVSEAQVLVSSLVARGIDQSVIVDLLVAGIEDGMGTNAPSISLKDARIEVVSYYSGINKSVGENFLAQNAEMEGIVVSESGLQYQVFAEGSGLKPNITDTVIVHYTGRFVDGREFESTIPSMRPSRFTPLDVIPGWTEGVQLMKEGGQYRFFLPYGLAYGEAGNAGIEPYSALVFDIELLKVIKYVPNN